MCIDIKERDFKGISDLEWAAFNNYLNIIGETEGDKTSAPKISNFDSWVGGTASSQKSEYGCVNSFCAGK